MYKYYYRVISEHQAEFGLSGARCPTFWVGLFFFLRWVVEVLPRVGAGGKEIPAWEHLDAQ